MELQHPIVMLDYNGYLVIPYYAEWVQWIFDLPILENYPV